MGKQTNQSSDGPGKPPVTTGTSQGTGKTGGGGSRTQNTAQSGTTQNGNPGSRNAAETEKPARPNLVSIPIPGEPQSVPQGAADKKKKKDRPSGLSYNSKNKRAASAETQALVGLAVGGTFEALSSRLGEHWKLSDQELQNIVRPASNILAKMVDTDKLEQYSDGAALAMALTFALIPRAVQSKNKAKLKKEDKPNAAGPKPASTGSRAETNPSRGANSGPDPHEPRRVETANTKQYDSSNVKFLLESISAVGQ